MKEWFKMRTVWGASILRMTAEEAGRLIKAVYLYERTGERQVLKKQNKNKNKKTHAMHANASDTSHAMHARERYLFSENIIDGIC